MFSNSNTVAREAFNNDPEGTHKQVYGGIKNFQEEVLKKERQSQLEKVKQPLASAQKMRLVKHSTKSKHLTSVVDEELITDDGFNEE